MSVGRGHGANFGSVPGGGGGFRNPRDAAGAKLGKLHEIQGVMQSLRTPLETPDLTDAILSRVEVEKPFLDGSERRWIWAGRASIAAGILLLLGGVVVLHSVAPQSTTWSGKSAPLSAVIDNAQAEVAESYQNFRAQIASVSNIVPCVEVPAACQPAAACAAPTGCWASPMLTVSCPTAGAGDSGGAASPFLRRKADFLQGQYLAATVLDSKPVAPAAPH